jgi:hypothetical protein
VQEPGKEKKIKAPFTIKISISLTICKEKEHHEEYQTEKNPPAL